MCLTVGTKNTLQVLENLHGCLFFVKNPCAYLKVSICYSQINRKILIHFVFPIIQRQTIFCIFFPFYFTVSLILTLLDREFS